MKPLVLTRTSRLPSRFCHFLHTPFNVRRTQLIGAAAPVKRLESQNMIFGQTYHMCFFPKRTQGHQHIRLFRLGVGVVLTKCARE